MAKGRSACLAYLTLTITLILTLTRGAARLLGEVQRLGDLPQVLCRVLVEQLLRAALRLVPDRRGARVGRSYSRGEPT